MIMREKLKDRLLPLLEEKQNEYLSGEDAARRLNVSRSAVWKAVNELKKDGYSVESVTNRGYRLAGEYDVLSRGEIIKRLGTGFSRLNIEVQRTVTSTNAVLKERAASGETEGTVLIAAEQTAGRGRFTRRFHSPAGTGIYMSLLLRPRLCANDASLITTAAAVAAAEAAEAVSGRKAGIKWVNDVFMDGKKVCGILTEAALDIESGTLEYAVLGIGINVYPPENGFPDDIKDTAGSVLKKRTAGAKNLLAAEFIKRFYGCYENITERNYINSYRERCIVIDRDITVISGGKEMPAHCLDVDSDCRLTVRFADGEIKKLSSGEISIKMKGVKQ